MKNIGDAIAPIAIAKGRRMKKNIGQQHPHPLIYLASTQGDKIIPKAQANTAPISPNAMSTINKSGTKSTSPIKEKNALTLGTDLLN